MRLLAQCISSTVYCDNRKVLVAQKQIGHLPRRASRSSLIIFYIIDCVPSVERLTAAVESKIDPTRAHRQIFLH